MATRRTPLSPASNRGEAEAMEAVRRDPAVLREALPGASEVDPELLEDVVGQVNRLFVTRSIGTAREVAERVVELLALGDLQDFLAVAGRHATWRAMRTHQGLRMPFSQIWSSVGVLDQLRKLPKEVGEALPVSHHRKLLVVKDEPTRLALATRAVAGKLTAQQLTEEIHAAGAAAPTGGRGRKHLPPIAKIVRALRKGTAAFTPDPVSEATLGAAELDGLLAELTAHERELARLRDHVHALRQAVSIQEPTPVRPDPPTRTSRVGSGALHPPDLDR